MTRPERLTGNNIILLVCLLALILFYPLFPKDNSLVRDLLLTGIFFSGIYSLEFSARSRMVLLPLASLTAATTWIHHYIETDWMSLIDFGTSSVTLAVIVVLMIRHIARSRVVNRLSSSARSTGTCFWAYSARPCSALRMASTGSSMARKARVSCFPTKARRNTATTCIYRSLP
jgi:hypothetical protein